MAGNVHIVLGFWILDIGRSKVWGPGFSQRGIRQVERIGYFRASRDCELLAD